MRRMTEIPPPLTPHELAIAQQCQAVFDREMYIPTLVEEKGPVIIEDTAKQHNGLFHVFKIGPTNMDSFLEETVPEQMSYGTDMFSRALTFQVFTQNMRQLSMDGSVQRSVTDRNVALTRRLDDSTPTEFTTTRRIWPTQIIAYQQFGDALTNYATMLKAFEGQERFLAGDKRQVVQAAAQRVCYAAQSRIAYLEPHDKLSPEIGFLDNPEPARFIIALLRNQKKYHVAAKRA